MTKTEDKIAVDAAKAASLIKQTAESTATALNIQYMQKDISAINLKLDKIVETQEGKVAALENKIESLQRTVAIGIGVASTIAFALPLLIKFFLPGK